MMASCSPPAYVVHLSPSSGPSRLPPSCSRLLPTSLATSPSSSRVSHPSLLPHIPTRALSALLFAQQLRRSPPCHRPQSMPTYTNIVVAGAGGVGSRVVAEGVKEGLNITVFSRSASTTVPSGAKLVVVDYTSDSSLEQALKEAKAEVVVSGIQISPPNVPAQEALARAAKKVATVKLFVPSEYGNPTYGEKDKNSKIYAKTAFHHFLEDLKLPYLLVFTGPFADTVWNP